MATEQEQAMCNNHAVMRKPILPEDEGRYHFLGVFPSQDAAVKFVKEYCSDGFFKLCDFAILKQEEKHDE